MITIEKLQQESDKILKLSEPLKAKLKKAEDEFNKECDKLEKPFKKMLQDFYDQELKDKKGKPIKKGMVITNGKVKLNVVNRGTQFVFGNILNNPRVMAIKDGGKKEIHILKKDLINYTIIKR